VRWLAALAVFLAADAWSASAAPPAVKPEPTVNVTILPPARTKEEIDSDNRAREEKTELDRRAVELTGKLASYTASLFGATIALAVFTAVLAIFARIQSRDVKRSLETFERAVRAAESAATGTADLVRTTRDIERPYIFAGVFLQPIMGQLVLVDASSGLGNRLQVSFWNYGKTPAEIQMLQVSSEPRSETPQDFAGCAFEERIIQRGLGIAAASEYQLDVIHQMTPDQLVRINRREDRLFCYGQIQYSDVHTGSHNTSFCWEINLHDGKPCFVISDTPLNRRT
jgi:hypothetical protein